MLGEQQELAKAFNQHLAQHTLRRNNQHARVALQPHYCIVCSHPLVLATWSAYPITGGSAWQRHISTLKPPKRGNDGRGRGVDTRRIWRIDHFVPPLGQWDRDATTYVS